MKIKYFVLSTPKEYGCDKEMTIITGESPFLKLPCRTNLENYHRNLYKWTVMGVSTLPLIFSSVLTILVYELTIAIKTNYKVKVCISDTYCSVTIVVQLIPNHKLRSYNFFCSVCNIRIYSLESSHDISLVLLRSTVQM
uniref:Uncharacterized protein n=1 Tax=Glossina brevipalpis TaxID=37001 RepID=A0A1A9X244_9MUSC